MQITDIRVDKDNREKTIHSSGSFPLAVYHSVMSRNVIGFTKLHWHDELQFCLVDHGGILFHVNDVQCLIEEGNGIFINSGQLHMASPHGDPDSSYICIDAGRRLFGALPESVTARIFEDPRNTTLTHLILEKEEPWHADVLEKIRMIYEAGRRGGAGAELSQAAGVLLITASVLEHSEKAPEPRKRSRANPAVRSIINFIAENYGNKITLKDIAAAASYAESECCRIFRKYTGRSVFTYLREYRLEKSTGLLTGTDLSVSDVAYTCGFSSASYFIKAFREQFGMTPLRYRRQA
ncbi:MAG: AraC family transcriptional regulator [Anaerovoracaceae bacterium]|jgi:AraC-like DNA-binding protein